MENVDHKFGCRNYPQVTSLTKNETLMPLRCVPAKINCLLLSGFSTNVGEIKVAMETL